MGHTMTGSSPDKAKHSFFDAWKKISKELMILLFTTILTVPSFLSVFWPSLSSIESTQIEISSEAECFFSEDGSSSNNDSRTTDTFSFALCDHAIDYSLPHFDNVVKSKSFQTNLHGNCDRKSEKLDKHFQSLVSTLNSLSYTLYTKEPWRRYRGWYLPVLSDDDSTHNTLLYQTKLTHSHQVVKYCMTLVRTIDNMRQVYFEDPGYLRYKENRRKALRVMRTNLLKIAYLQKPVKIIAWLLDVIAIVLLIIYVFFTYLPMQKRLKDFEQNHGRLLCIKTLILLAIGILLPISIIYAITDAFCIMYAAFGMSLLFSIYLWAFRNFAFWKKNNENQNEKNRRLKGYIEFLLMTNKLYFVIFGFFSILYFLADYSVGDLWNGLARLHVGAIFWVFFCGMLLIFPPDFGSKKVQRIVRVVALLLGPVLVLLSICFNYLSPAIFPINIFYSVGWLFPDWPIWVEILGSRFCFSFAFIFLLIFAVKKRHNAHEKISKYLDRSHDVLDLARPFGYSGHLDKNGNIYIKWRCGGGSSEGNNNSTPPNGSAGDLSSTPKDTNSL